MIHPLRCSKLMMTGLVTALACGPAESRETSGATGSGETGGASSRDTGTKADEDGDPSPSTSETGTVSESEQDTSTETDTEASTGTDEESTGTSTDTGESSDTEESSETEDSDGSADERCASADLVWKTARKAHYESYPDPDSPECEKLGCEWAGLFAGCASKRPEAWVQANDIASIYPGFRDLVHHEICLRAGDRLMVVNVIDTCVDEDCDGCCERAQGDNDAFIELESYTNERWDLPDGNIEWADLGRRVDPICD